MGIIGRQTVKGSIANYLGIVLGFLTTIYILPYCLSPEQIGVYRFVLDTGMLIGGFATLAIRPVTMKFFPFLRNDKNNHNGYTIHLFAVPIIGFVLLSTIIYIFKDIFIQYFSKTTRGYEDYFHIVFPLALFIALFSSYESFSVIFKRITVPKIARDIIVRVLLIFIILLFFYNIISFKGLIYLLPVIYVIVLIIVQVYIRILGQKIFPFKDFKLIDKKMAKSMITFGGFIILSIIGTGLVNKIDIFVISSELGFGATGIYTTALYIAVIIEIPARTLFQMMSPILVENFKNNNIKNIEEVYKKTTQNTIIISGLLTLLIFVNVDNIFRLIPNGEVFAEGKYVLIFIAISKFIDTSIGINYTILGYSKYYKYVLPLTLFMGISNFFLNYLFINLWGITGSAVATLVVITIYNILILSIIYVKFKIQPFALKNIFPLMLLLFTLGITFLIPDFSNLYIDVVIKSVLVTSIIAFVALKFNLSDDITLMYHNIMKKLKIKK